MKLLEKQRKINKLTKRPHSEVSSEQVLSVMRGDYALEDLAASIERERETQRQKGYPELRRARRFLLFGIGMTSLTFALVEDALWLIFMAHGVLDFVFQNSRMRKVYKRKNEWIVALGYRRRMQQEHLPPKPLPNDWGWYLEGVDRTPLMTALYGHPERARRDLDRMRKIALAGGVILSLPIFSLPYIPIEHLLIPLCPLFLGSFCWLQFGGLRKMAMDLKELTLLTSLGSMLEPPLETSEASSPEPVRETA